MLITITILTILVLLLTLIPVAKCTHWLVRDLDFPRFQLAVISLALLVAQAAFLDINRLQTQLLFLVTTGCLAWQLWWILPYTPIWRKAVKNAAPDSNQPQLTFLTSNVLAPNRNADKLLALVNKHQPDILVTLESDTWWESQLNSLEASMPYTIKCPLDNLYGMHVFSKLPLINAETRFLVEDDKPSMHACIELPSGDHVRVHFLHPAPPSPTENEASKERDAELIVVAKSIDHIPEPIVVTGDMNDVAWSETTRLFRKISGLLDPRIGRGMFNTFHADYFFLRWPLDHLFHSTHFQVADMQRLPSIGSDHFPLLTKLVFAPQDQHDQASEQMPTTQQDYDRAEEITQQGNIDDKDVPNPNQ